MNDASASRLVFLEVSKVRSYHSTLMDGLVNGYRAAGLEARWGRPILYGHESFYNHLSADARASVEFTPIAVIDQDSRRWISKSLLEAWNVLRCLKRLGRRDLLFVTTIMPSALILVEIIKWFFPGKRIVVMQHGELEGAFQKHKQHVGSFGFYILAWLRLRRLASSTHIAVLDDFIADEVRRRFPRSVAPDHLFVVPLPMMAHEVPNRESGAARCCFIGFDTPNKGFPVFERLAGRLQHLEFRVIGQGVDRDLRTGAAKPLKSTDDFLGALAKCDIALLPYVDGYSCSLSAAATDALACGLHLLASDRGCFLALAQAFGEEGVTICRTEAEFLERLRDEQWVQARVAGRAARLARIQDSHYGLRSVGRSLEQLMAPSEAHSPRRLLLREMA